MAKPRLLVTRFSPNASHLADQLNQQGVFAVAQPLLATKKSAEFENVTSVVKAKHEYIIAVSVNAVEYTHQALVGHAWPVSHYFSVGKKTQAHLTKVTNQKVIIPESLFSSEGLLALPELNDISGKHILILRGVGGRELLADVLISRGAIVEYYQPYQRIALDLCGAILVKEWQRKRINSAIISSIELLEQLLKIVPKSELDWVKKFTVYAPSKRITQQALLLGWSDVAVLPGMQDQQILNYFK